ncbi:hypothetical protein [Streptomyces sp. NPDC049881]|uniref:hypothetical protein n=1 Tax=Streptomyces sp. NPDC049881 TaxID=3155778 RepID=UPI003432F002
MPHLDFDHEDVEAKARRKPWKRRADFREEIKPDDMADLAVAYARAAPEAHHAGALAKQATEVASEAGELDGSSLIAPEKRIDETAGALHGNGRGIDEAVRHIVQSMNRAIDAVDAVDQVIDESGIGLDTTLRRHQQDVVTEWNEWQELREREVAAAIAGIDPTVLLFPQLRPLTLTYRDDSVTLAPLPTLGGISTAFAWEDLPDSLADRIRKRHIASVAEAAKAADDRITHELEDYRADLLRYALRLGEEGYDLDGGPFALFTSPEMADFVAARLHEELNGENPSVDAVKMYTEGLAAILDGIVEQDGSIVPQAQLTDDQRSYLSKVLGALTAKDWETLGSFEPLPSTAGLPMAVAQREVLERIANALNVFTDPSLGGYDVWFDEGRQKLPEGVRDLLAMTANTDPADPLIRHIGEWNGFGTVMSHADVRPHDSWAELVGRAALDAQHAAMGQYRQSITANLVPATGSGDLLGMVALNSEASARLINDDDFRAGLLTSYWEDSEGIARLIDSGTTVPAGMDWNDWEAKQYIEAAYHFLTDAKDHSDTVIGESNAFNTARFDHTAFKWVLGDTMLNYMDFISQVSEESQLGTEDMKLFGTDYTYSFQIGRDARKALVETMLHGGEGDWLSFTGGATEWMVDRATFLFQGSGGKLTETSDFENIGSVAGAIADAQQMDGVESERFQQMTAMRGIGSTLGVASMLIPGPKVIPVAANLGTWALQDTVYHKMGDPNEEINEAQWKLDNDGDIVMRVAVADAALRADFRGADGEVDQLTRDMMHDPAKYGWDDAEAAAKDIGGEYFGPYVNAMERGYDLATHNDLEAK